jgi:hypothetical protein
MQQLKGGDPMSSVSRSGPFALRGQVVSEQPSARLV